MSTSLFRSDKPVTEGQLARAIALTLLGSLMLGGVGGFVTTNYFGGLQSFTPILGVTRSMSRSTAPLAGSEPAVPVAVPVSEDDLITSVVAHASPAVASIEVSVEVAKYDRSVDTISPFGDLSPFRIEVPRLKQNGTQRQTIGGGTGFFVSADGLMLTNRHVVERTDATYTVVTSDGKDHTAKVLDRDPVNDLAVLKVLGGPFPSLKFGDSAALRIGQRAIAIGFALGEFNNTVSVGVVSGLNRSIQAGGGASGNTESLEGLIQTDAAINPGNSGGPLIDIHGEVIGVDVAVAQGSQSIGFALPVNAVKPVVMSVEKNGRIVRPQLGVQYVPVTAAVASDQKLSVDYGALILSGTQGSAAVLPGSPAEAAGLKEHDVILEVDGTRVDDKHSLGSLIVSHQVGETLTLKILRDDKQQIVRVKLQEWKR